MSDGWVLISENYSSKSGGQFPAEEVFKHFVIPVPAYDARTMRMSREAYFEDLIRQGLIDCIDDENAHVVTARANPRIRVHGKFERNGTFVIHVVESNPPPTSESWRMLKVGIAFLKDGMYSLRLPLDNLMPLEYLTEHIGYTAGNIEFAGECSDAWEEITQYRRVWRVEFGRRRGPRKGPTRGFESHEQAFEFVLSLICQQATKGRSLGIDEIAEMADHEKPAKTTKSDRDPRSTVKWLQRIYKKMKLRSWNDVIELALSCQKKSPS
jgi:hypothetical protein